MGDIPKKAPLACTERTVFAPTVDRSRHCDVAGTELLLSLVSSGQRKGAEGVREGV